MTENTATTETTETTKGERIPLRKKTDKSLRSIAQSFSVLAGVLGFEAEETEDKLGIKGFAGTDDLKLADELAMVKESLNALADKVRAIDPTLVLAFRGGGALALKVGMVVVGSKAASASVRAMLGEGRAVSAVDHDLGLVSIEGVASPLPRSFVARKDLAGRGAKAE